MTKVTSELDNNNDDSNKSKSTLKRGRKKKEISPDNIMFKILQVEEKDNSESNCDPISEVDKLEAPTVKKRGRKPKETKAVIEDIEMVGNKKMPFILMLPISSSSVEMDTLTSANQPLSYFDNHPSSYYPYENGNLGSSAFNNMDFDKSDMIPSKDSEEEILEDESYSDFLLCDFMDSNLRNSWPETTRVHCWWCTLKFSNSPIGLPIKYQNGKYKTLGCFCSYNCALSYNLLNSVNDKNERTCLLHQLYKQKINEYKPIKPAPPKEILTIYGGNVTIEKYKKELVTNTATYSVLVPPLISIIPQVEKYNNKINLHDEFIPVNNSKVQKATQSLKLSRKKSTTDKHTLEHCMGLFSQER